MTTMLEAKAASERELPAERLDMVGDARFELEAKEAPAEGPAPRPRFVVTAYTGAAMRLKGWRYPVVMDLQGLAIESQARPIRFDHDSAAGIGHTDSIAIREGHLIATGVISRETEHAREVVAAARNGFPWQASIGAAVEEHEYVPEGKTVSVNGRDWRGPLNVIRRATLGEISFVDAGADGATSAAIAARADEEGEPAPLPVITSGSIFEERRRRDARAEARAQKTREALDVRGCSRLDEIEALADQADQGDWEPEEYELKLRRLERPVVPAVRAQRAPGPRVLEAAFLRTVGLSEQWLAHFFDPATVEASAAPEYDGIGFGDIIHATIAASGRSARPGRISNDVIRTAFEANQQIQASGIGFSTVSLTGILAPAANKIMLASYQAEPLTGLTISSSSSATDFKVANLYRMTGSGLFLKVPADGELKHLQLLEEGYTQKVDTWGRTFALTRQMMINDDLDAFAQIPRILGRSAAATIQSAIFEIFNTNPNNIFSAANGNLLTGAGSALSMESLGQAITLFYKQTDAAGLPIMLTPRYLVVPPELAFTAESILASNQVNETTTAGTPSPAGNPFQGLLTLIVSPWLSNATMTGSSATAWLVLADPGVGGVVNVAYLRGRRIPIIETSETDFDTLGMRWRGFFDFGVGVMDYRAGVKSEGTGAVILAATPTKESKTSKSGG